VAVAARRGGRGRFFSTAAGLSVRIVLGFGAGLAVGVVVQDPGLVFGVFAGGAEPVELARLEPARAPEEAAAARPAETPPVASASAPAKPAPAAPAPVPAPAVARAPAAKPRLPAVSAPPPGFDGSGSGFSVQVGAFSERDSARRLEDRLSKLGFPTYTVDGGGSGGKWRVRVGPVSDRSEAEALARTLKQDESLPTWILQTGND